MSRRPKSPYTTADEIREQADRGLSDPSKAQAALRAIRRLGQHLDSDIDYEIHLAERRGREPRAKPKQAKAVVGYSIDHGRHDVALAEHRSGGAPPFRCPEKTYGVVAEAIDGGSGAVKFNWIHQEVERLMRAEIPDYQVRVATRFLVHAGVLGHARARFTHDSTKNLPYLAMKAWKAWEKKTKAGETPA